MNREHKSPEEQYANWCRHFNGAQNERCKAGMFYVNVRTGPHLPCFKDLGCSSECPQASFLTEEEIAAKVKQNEAAFVKWMSDMGNNICPHCGTPITLRQQIGRSVYARPCMHRLYQGRLKNETHQST